MPTAIINGQYQDGWTNANENQIKNTPSFILYSCFAVIS